MSIQTHTICSATMLYQSYPSSMSIFQLVHKIIHYTLLSFPTKLTDPRKSNQSFVTVSGHFSIFHITLHHTCASSPLCKILSVASNLLILSNSITIWHHLIQSYILQRHYLNYSKLTTLRYILDKHSLQNSLNSRNPIIDTLLFYRF